MDMKLAHYEPEIAQPQTPNSARFGVTFPNRWAGPLTLLLVLTTLTGCCGIPEIPGMAPLVFEHVGATENTLVVSGGAGHTVELPVGLNPSFFSGYKSGHHLKSINQGLLDDVIAHPERWMLRLSGDGGFEITSRQDSKPSPLAEAHCLNGFMIEPPESQQGYRDGSGVVLAHKAGAHESRCVIGIANHFAEAKVVRLLILHSKGGQFELVGGKTPIALDFEIPALQVGQATVVFKGQVESGSKATAQLLFGLASVVDEDGKTHGGYGTYNATNLIVLGAQR